MNVNIINSLSSLLLRTAACSFAVSLLKANLQRGSWNKPKAKLASVVTVFFLLESAIILTMVFRLTGLMG
jgi:hypothetical protein